MRENIEPTEEASEEWSSFLRSAMPKTRATTMETAQWNQGDPYNRKTPKIGKDSTLTGCVATAMGIVMKYHEYPAKAVNPPAKNTYKVGDNEVSATITYGAYDWDNMLDTYTKGNYTDAQADAVATLLFHCGVNVEMEYGTDASAANNMLSAKALRDVFGYSPEIRFLCREAYRWKEWKAMLREELDNGYPVLYDGVDSSEDGGGHAFVCDGYDEKDYYHINWGWGGYANGYFALNLLAGFKDDNNMITHIRPEATGETYYVRPYLSSAEYSESSDTVWSNFLMKYCALDDKEFWFGLGVADKSNAVVQAPKEDEAFSGELEAFLGGWREYEADSVYTTITTKTLADDQRVTLLCSLDGKNWEVMHTTDSVPLGISKETEIDDDEDDDPTANETVDADALRVWSAEGQLFIQTAKAETVRIYTLDGRPYKTKQLSEGLYVEEMPRGIYVVVVGGKSFKMMF